MELVVAIGIEELGVRLQGQEDLVRPRLLVGLGVVDGDGLFEIAIAAAAAFLRSGGGVFYWFSSGVCFRGAGALRVGTMIAARPQTGEVAFGARKEPRLVDDAGLRLSSIGTSITSMLKTRCSRSSFGSCPSSRQVLTERTPRCRTRKVDVALVLRVGTGVGVRRGRSARPRPASGSSGR